MKEKSRLLLWDYDRGSVPYDALWTLLLLLLLLVPASWWRDPLRERVAPSPHPPGDTRAGAAR